MRTIFNAVCLVCLPLVVTTLRAADASDAAAPAGMMLVDKLVWYALADEPNQHFHLARLNYLRHDDDHAAKEIRTAAAIMKLATGHANPVGKKALADAQFELNFLADEIAARRPVAASGLDQTFARAHLALSTFNRGAALDHLKRRDFHAAGHHLRAAAHDVEYARAWAGERVPEKSPARRVNAEKLAEQLLADAEVATETVVKELEQLQQVAEMIESLIKVAR